MKERILMAMLNCMPKKSVSRWMGRLARSPHSRRLIPYFIRRFDVDLSQVEKPVSQYQTLLDFFVRGLKEGARPVDPDPERIVSPVDGTVSQMGEIHEGTILQAKGVTYTLEALLGGNGEKMSRFEGGRFITLYLSPRDYHRIHTPIQGRVTGLTYIPGSLFPVNALGVQRVRGLFARNERLITFLQSPAGDVALVKVGATNVGSIRVVYDREIVTNCRGRKQILSRDYPGMEALEKGEELGRFEFGSTVILLFEADRIDWVGGLSPGTMIRMGEPIASIRRD
ncbi:archaetidylserine decarboxylase [Kroppenstedtia eburnea]|uniref:Phosphatidylserine decarboxylase proenzyme n=1 Tax=Kroppenstedtia eburnea TaxID=714067 RepID=A0A1N7KJA0_9BACL|nr:archaetidylserine decarboxylase [Kroppenstedtia eburnea]EGK12064.1 phosphatidylserine decarboxylase [Desmospora sp. 8437]QKI82960.1 phosphatidylserine decarboxylase [Kroppenstedtia eburnea]SIS61510.1 phosphatidylserine decarboxylase [Kroppenstedtia eburnea]